MEDVLNGVQLAIKLILGHDKRNSAEGRRMVMSIKLVGEYDGTG